MKTAIKIILAALISTLLLMTFACRSKKSLSEKEKTVQIDTVTVVETQTDTIFRDRIIEKTKPVYSEIIVESPCDSLGNLKPIDQRIGSGGNEAWIYTKNGKLYIGQKIDSTQSAMQETYIARWRHDSINLRKQLLKESATAEKVKVVVWPWWLWTALIIGGLSILLNLYQKFKPI